MKRHIGSGVRALLAVVIVAALVAFARTLNWSESWRAIQSTSAGVLAVAALAHLASVALKAARWWVFLRPIGVASFGLALRATLTGAALNNVLIANSGEAARIVFLSRSTRASSARVLASLLLERFFEIFGYVIILAAFASLLSLPPMLDGLRPFAFVALGGMLALLIFLARYPQRQSAELSAVASQARLHRLRHYVTRFLRTLTAISNGRRFAAAMALTIGVWSLQVVSYHLTAMAAHFPITIVGTIAALLACNVSFALRATPGNVGVFQAVYALMAIAFGMDREAAIAVALLIQTQQMVPVTLLGVVAAPTMLRSQALRANP